jgi:hypothetical protein
MRNKLIKIIAVLFLLLFLSFAGCGGGHVTVGVGVYAPGAWGPYGGYRPPVGIGYPVY